MIWENTKLLLRLYYRPLSAMSSIIDEGHWLYAAVAVAALSILMQSAVTSHIYNGYEAVYRQVDKPQIEELEASTTPALASPAANLWPQEAEADEYEDSETPGFTFDRLPLPVLGNHGWWFLSFEPGSFFSTVLGIAVLYVPCLILLTALSGSVGSFSVVLRRDYGPLLTCALMAWAAAHLPFALAGVALAPMGFGARAGLVSWALSAVCFGLFMALGLRTLFGTTFKKSVVLACFGALSFSIQSKLFGAISLYFLSPFLLYYAYIMFRGDIGDIGISLRQRQGFRRSLEAATINPHDASAHYQLGLIFQYRRQHAEAVSRFQQAVFIDNDETDAHFQLGRIAREQGRLQEAIDYFAVVLSQDDKHAHSEIWREVGATYLAAQMFGEAREALETFVERRAYDPEGLYYFGKTLEHLGDQQQAKAVFGRCIEAVKTMPHYRYREQRKWHKLARERLAAGQQSAA